jgi:hypothetical protein
MMKTIINKLNKQNPGYYVPLPYAMAIHRSVDRQEADANLYSGMQLYFRKMEIPSMSIAVMAYYNDRYNYIGFIPNGMLSRIEELLNFEDSLLISLERVHCNRLANTFWITIDELPNVADLIFYR